MGTCCRCQQDACAQGSSCSGSGSDDSAAETDQQRVDVADTDRGGGVRKRLRPGPVPKLEAMTLQSFKEGGYFDMQIQVSPLP